MRFFKKNLISFIYFLYPLNLNQKLNFCQSFIDYLLPHPIWSEKEVKSVEIKHRDPKGISDRLAYIAVQVLRKSFDLASGYTIGDYLKTLDERSVLVRCIFLETVAGTIDLIIF